MFLGRLELSPSKLHGTVSSGIGRVNATEERESEKDMFSQEGDSPGTQPPPSPLFKEKSPSPSGSNLTTFSDPLTINPPPLLRVRIKAKASQKELAKRRRK